VNEVQTKVVRIGTRGSSLARWQARAVQDSLMAAQGLVASTFETLIIRTSGDRIQDRALIEAGGKGLFTKEIDEALLSGAIDLAVHSAKDMPTRLPEGLMVGAYLEREDPRDAFIGHEAERIEDLLHGARVGTASLRRQALLRRARSDLEVGLLRGNVETRLRRVREGAFDATLLALAGLARLGLADAASSVLDAGAFPPACGQGAVAVTCRAEDAGTRNLLATIDHRETHLCIACERAFLAALDGSCRTPIAGHAIVVEDTLRFRGLVLSPDGTAWHEEEGHGALMDAAAIGSQAGATLKARAPSAVLAALGIG
jgi:hydroxymethylbilane synthase